MLRAQTQITDKNVKVRFYRYSDPNMGWGDVGTHTYVTVPLTAFTEIRKEYQPDNIWFYYKFTGKWFVKLTEILGKTWWVGIGYQLATSEIIEEDKKSALSALATAKATLASIDSPTKLS